jgi:uncharacterized protein YbaP (TraB family)
MKRTFLFCLLCQFFTLPLLLNAQKSNTPKTLLWRISGNGLKKDSYLYGTMHVQDKRVFNFSDSLYHYLEKADGYAMEVDLRDFIDTMIQRAITDHEAEFFRDDEEETISKPSGKKNATIDSLLKLVKDKNDPASRKRLIKMREALVRMSLKKRAEMPTIMDAWFYGIARRQGKWLGSVEDVRDQLPLVDEVGSEMDEGSLKSSPAEVGRTLENMIQIYSSRDLDALYDWVKPGMGQKESDRIFVRRNLKMIRSMDSLARIRSVFFAVGAAHLPGDSGVIKLLRDKGYTVTPVLSSKYPDPDKYMSKLAEAPWLKVEDRDKSLWIEMPTSASDITMLGDALVMRYSMDITTMTFFMVASIEVPEGAESQRIKDALNNNKKVTVLSQKEVENAGLKGLQGDALSNNSYYRIQYLYRKGRVYMLMAGGEKKKTLESADVARFFQSFAPREVVKPLQPWYSQQLSEKGMSVDFPRKPRHNRQMEKEMDDAETQHVVYDLTDLKADVYMMLRIADLRVTNVIASDSSYFQTYRSSFASTIDSVTRDEAGLWEGFPVFYLEGYTKKRDVLIRVMALNRGNRNYTLYAGGNPGKNSQAILDRFFQSFKLLPYQTLPRQKQTSAEGNFSSTVPKPFYLYQDTEEGETPLQLSHYVSADSIEAVWYEVVKTPIPKYMWATSDSGYFNMAVKAYISWDDSVLRQQPVVNNGLKGMEWVIHPAQSHVEKRIRIFFSGDSIYKVIAYIPAPYINAAHHNAFFEDFRIVKQEKKADMLKSKASVLLNDLQSSDSATAAEALGALWDAPFTKKELPLLYDAYKKPYADDSASSYYSVRSQLQFVIAKLADNSTLRFVKDNYKFFAGNRESLKMEMLNLLAAIQTQESYTLLKELLLNSTPQEAGDHELSYRISDSLKLTATLFPEILKLAGRPQFGDRIMQITAELLDSNIILPATVMPYAPAVYQYTDSIINVLRKTDSSDIEGYAERSRIHLLARLKQPEAYQLLQKYTSIRQTFIRMEAAMQLLKNEQKVEGDVFRKIAADRWFRRDLYDSLIALGKENLFPVKYLTQELMAESDMYNIAYDETPVTEMELLGVRQMEYKGELKKFYLYRIQLGEGDEDEVETYLGIAGPYSANEKDMHIKISITGLYTTETFDEDKIDEHFAAYLKEIAEYYDDEE